MSILFPRRRRRRTSKPKQRRSRGRLHLELLEQRHVLAVTLAPLLDVEAPAGKWILAPLTAVDDSGGPVTFDVQITDDDLSWSLAGAAGKSLALEVAGVDAQGNDFSGTVIVRLFDEAAPQAVARIEQLAGAGYYDGASFLRVIDGLFAELGGPGTGMPLDDEFSDELTFNSPGLLAMASAGPDGGDAEFFLTAVYAAGSTDPISLADMPQELNFRRTIVGQLVAGFDVFAQVMSVETLTDGDDAGAPLQPVTIVSAQVIDDVQNGVLRVFVPASFVGGSAVVTVTAMGADMEMAAQSFTLLAVANDADDPPFLGPVGDAETAVGAATSLTLTATHLSGGDVHFSIVAAATLEPPANVQIVVDQQTGEATLTPMPGFVGTIELLARVRAADAADEADSYDTQAFTLTARGAVIDEVADQTTSMGESITLTLTSVDHVGSGVEYVVVDPTTFEAPANVTIVINQATGEVTLTPAAGFGGVIPLRAGVRSLVSPDEPLNYSTALFELQVSSDVSLAPLEDVELPGSKSVLVPLTGADAGGQGITYSFESSDPTVQFEIFASTSQSIVLNVTGLDADGNPFTGRLVLRLFEDVAPETTAHIKQLIADGFYDNLTFHRVIDGFMAQGGANAGTLIDDEFSSLLTFTSRGLLAMANRGPDTGDAQFFITALSSAGTDDPIPVAQMPQHLNFRHTIFGQLVEGFEVFESLMKTPVVLNPQTGEVSRPATEVKIISAEVIDDDQNGVLRIFAPAGLTGTATITVTAANGTGQSATQTFTVSGVADTRVDPPFLGPVTNRTTVAGTPNSFTLTSTDTEGAGVFYRIVDPVTLQPPANVTVNINQATGEVTLTPAAGFTGTINLLAGVRGAGAADVPLSYDTQAFTLTVTATATGPTLNAVANQTSTAGAAVNFTLTSNDPTGDGVVYVVRDATTFGQPANVTVVIDQDTGAVTLTPAAGFSGTINLVAGVRSATAADQQANYDTRAFTLTVTATGAPAAPTGLAVDAASTSGPFDGNGYVSTPTPTLVVMAETGSTVQIKRNGVVIATATETSAGSGQYRAALPAGTLAVGANALTAAATNANGTSADSTELSVIFAPDYSTGVYVVPGAPGAAQTITFTWTARHAAYANEFGYFIVTAADGSVGGVTPGSAGYAQAALSSSSRGVIFAQGQAAGATTTVSLQGGQMIVFYMIQNNTTANFLSRNPGNIARGNNNSRSPLAFFSVEEANPDGRRHTQIIADPTTGHVQYNWEDLYGLGDSDFNDAVIAVRAGTTSGNPATVRVPGAGATTPTLATNFVPGRQSTAAAAIGIYFVDGPSGAVNGLMPGSAGYASAAFGTGNFITLFGPGASGAQQTAIAAGRQVAFFALSSGTVANFLTANPTNATTGSPLAFFSLDAANPDGANHFRWFADEHQAVDPGATQLHVHTALGGGEAAFGAFALGVRFQA